MSEKVREPLDAESKVEPCDCCDGNGEIFAICILRSDGRGGPGKLPCPTCNGTGVESRPEAWRTEARFARDLRVVLEFSLRDVAKALGSSPVNVSAMEQAKANPRLMREHLENIAKQRGVDAVKAVSEWRAAPKPILGGLSK